MRDGADRVRGGVAALALAGALALYGAFSAPAPPSVRAAEAAIGALLLIAVGWRRPLFVVTGHALRGPSLPSWEALAVPALGWLLWVPLLRGAALGWETADMLRDMVPLLYLFLPVLLVPVLRGAGGRAVVLLGGGLILAGLLLALRWWKQAQWGFGAVGVRAMPDGGAYFLNAPVVLFAAVALPALALGLVAGGVTGRGGTAGRWSAAVACAVAGALCLAALAGAVHRTALGLAALSGLVLALWWGRRAPRTLLPVAAAGLCALLAFGDPLSGAWEQVAEKTRLTGANTRWEEAGAVLEHVARSPWSLLFGDGWGAKLANPAVGGWRVAYTHTLATYVLVKGGVLGALALAAYLGGLAPLALRLLRQNPPLGWSLLPPLLMALGLHTSFKYLDTGLLLTLMVLGLERRKRLVKS
ncbi:hypothetical protein J2847_000195 [Azospirillum agricola]|uniref:hypothetical protein n=1 Tax=Azospirillum agricola TaxID=1720247 RepID=UPI002D7EDC82|nr:hypothetical protein [Azospirillum agricola]MBP2226928.1 hypothetical protein [Azospirillum agricola]